MALLLFVRPWSGEESSKARWLPYYAGKRADQEWMARSLLFRLLSKRSTMPDDGGHRASFIQRPPSRRHDNDKRTTAKKHATLHPCRPNASRRTWRPTAPKEHVSNLPGTMAQSPWEGRDGRVGLEAAGSGHARPSYLVGAKEHAILTIMRRRASGEPPTTNLFDESQRALADSYRQRRNCR